MTAMEMSQPMSLDPMEPRQPSSIPASVPPSVPPSVYPPVGPIVLTVGGTMERKKPSNQGKENDNSYSDHHHSSAIENSNLSTGNPLSKSTTALKSSTMMSYSSVNNGISLDDCRQYYSKRVQSLEIIKGSVKRHQSQNSTSQSDQHEKEENNNDLKNSETITLEINNSNNFSESEVIETVSDQTNCGDSNGNSKDAQPILSSDPELRVQQKFDQLKQSMISLIENDVCLMRQLLALTETMEEIRGMQELSPGSSLASVREGDSDSETQDVAFETPDRDDSESELFPDLPTPTADTQDVFNPIQSVFSKPKKQYFSRQNSVLRIPIPPNHHRPRHRTTISSVGSIGSVGSAGSRSGSGSDRDADAEFAVIGNTGISGEGPEQQTRSRHRDDTEHEETSSGVSSNASSITGGSIRSNASNRSSSGLDFNPKPKTFEGGNLNSKDFWAPTELVDTGITTEESDDQLSPLGETGSSSKLSSVDKSAGILNHESQASIDSGIHIISPGSHSSGAEPEVKDSEVFV